MPGTLLTLLLWLAVGGSANGEQASNQRAANPTLGETSQWIQSHVVGVTHTSRKTTVTYRLKKGKLPKESERGVLNIQESVSVATFDGCTLTLGQLIKGDDYSIVTVSTVPLDRLATASLKVENFDPVKTATSQESSETTIVPASDFVLTLEASANVIAWKRKSSGNIPLEQVSIPFDGKSSSLRIHSDDQGMPPRLLNAFNHAIKLCHVDTKPEPF